jgi:hypothetical protein
MNRRDVIYAEIEKWEAASDTLTDAIDKALGPDPLEPFTWGTLTDVSTGVEYAVIITDRRMWVNGRRVADEYPFVRAAGDRITLYATGQKP